MHAAIPVIAGDNPRIRNGKQFGRIDRVAGSGSFGANGDCRDGLLGGGSAIPVARGLLGTNYDFGDHAILTRHCALRFWGAFYGDSDWGSCWRGRG